MRLLPTVLLVLANALWGASYVVAKVALEEIPPPLLAALRFTIASIVLCAVTALRARFTNSIRMPPVADLLRLMALGLLGVAVNGLLGYWGVSLTTATDAALLIVGEVLFTTMLAVAVARERLALGRRMSMALGIAGVVVLIVSGASDSLPLAPARPLGDILILTGLAFEAAYTVLGTRLTQRYDALMVLMASFAGSCIVWVPVIGWYVVVVSVRMPGLTVLGGVLYLTLVNSVFCYLIWFAVLRRAGPTLGALSLMAQPVVGAFLGVLVLGDPVLPGTIVGGVCVLACLVLASVAR